MTVMVIRIFSSIGVDVKINGSIEEKVVRYIVEDETCSVEAEEKTTMAMEICSVDCNQSEVEVEI